MLCAALYPNVVQVYFNFILLSLLRNKWLMLDCLTYPVVDVLYQVRSPQENYKMTSKGAVKMPPKANELRFVTKNDGYVHIHPSSVNYIVR